MEVLSKLQGTEQISNHIECVSLYEEVQHKGNGEYFSDYLHDNFPHKKMTVVQTEVSLEEYTDFL